MQCDKNDNSDDNSPIFFVSVTVYVCRVAFQACMPFMSSLAFVAQIEILGGVRQNSEGHTETHTSRNNNDK